MPRVLAFTCSRYRPVLLRNSILQMQHQTYRVDHAVYINSDDPEKDQYLTDYTDLLNDVVSKNGNKVIVSFGRSFQQHRNHLEALRLVDLDEYDLFLKIDDDDIYKSYYVEEVVKDFGENRWDFSGNHCVGVINGARWRPDLIYKNLGAKSGDEDVGMSGTWAFSRSAINEITSIDEESRGFEDNIWEAKLKNNPDIKIYRRQNNNANYIYNIHGKNISTGDWLEIRQENARTQLKTADTKEKPMSGITSLRFASHFIKKAIPLLPRDIAKYVRQRFSQ